MDFFTSTRVLEWYANTRKEGFYNTPSPSIVPPSIENPPPKKNFAIFNLGGVIAMVISVVIGIAAAYLSWTCNTSINYNIVLKVIFALLAYVFGFIYILFYIIMRYDTCSYIQKTGYYT